MRLALLSRAPVDVAIDADAYTTNRQFVVRPTGGQRDLGAQPAPLADEWDHEAAFLWDDPVSRPTWYRRRAGALSTGSSGGREPSVIRIFDVFKYATGKSKGGPGPKIFGNSELEMKVYNTEGHQYGFHRGNGQDELWMQFRAESLNETEYGVIPLNAAHAVIAPPGISHRILGSKGFLRLNLYSHRPLTLRVDPRQAITSTSFQVDEVGPGGLPVPGAGEPFALCPGWPPCWPSPPRSRRAAAVAAAAAPPASLAKGASSAPGRGERHPRDDDQRDPGHRHLQRQLRPVPHRDRQGLLHRRRPGQCQARCRLAAPRPFPG